jgi:hypothetical protein
MKTIMIKVKKNALLWLASAILFLSLAGLFGWAIKFHRDYQNIPPDHLIGNKPSHVEKLEEKGFPFSFLVLGDTTGSETAETLIEMALRKEKPSFIIILGDFVKKPDIWKHRFFLTEMTVEIKLPFPVFLVAGNHDIDYTSSKKISDDRRVTPEVFESLYGAMNFDFIFNNCLFIICGVDLKNETSYLNYLRDTLSKKREGKRHIFVFVHFPPKGLAEYIGGSLPGEEEFFSLLETYKVTTCFFGDFHGYWRGQRKGVNLIVSGGGGRLKQSKPEWGKFHHILRVSVDNDIINEEVITLSDEFSFEDSFEEMVFTKFFPIVQNRGWILYGLFFLFLSLGIYSFAFFYISLRKKKLDEHKKS